MIVLTSFAFVAGIVVGILLETRYELTHNGRGFLVDHGRRVSPTVLAVVRVLTSRATGIALVVVALIVNAILGFALIVTRGDVEEALATAAESADRALETSDQLVELSTCIEEFQRDKGEALAARDDAQAKATAASVRLWASLRVSLLNPAAQLPDLIASIDRYLEELAGLQDVRDENPFPDPDRCRILVVDKKGASS